MTRRRALAAAVLAAAIVLSGCSGLPTMGPVSVGNAPDDAVDDPTRGSYDAESPQPGASPEEIVDGFLRASISPAQNWATAREFLAGELSETWDPSAGVLVDSLTDRTMEVVAATDDAVTITADVHGEASVDADGRYRLMSDGATEYGFELARDEDGEWRIVAAPQGIVLDRFYFTELYAAHDLFYFDSTWRHLVPDRRWFLARQNAATRIVQELVGGEPGEWLAPGVETAFGSELQLAGGTVDVDANRVAHVSITGAAGADDATISRMRAQLEQSLASASVRQVSLEIDGQESDIGAAAVASTRIDSRALVLTEEGFGYLSGSELVPVPDLSAILAEFPEEIASIALSPEQTVAAVGLADGGAMRVTADGSDEIAVDGPVVPPVLDGFGWVWTVAAGDPSTLTAWDADLAGTPMADGWADVSKVTAVAISRDGSRLAAIVTIGDQQWAAVSAIERDFDGRPLSVGEPVRVTRLRLAGIDLAWIDDGTLGIAAGGTDSAQIIQQPVGGPATISTGPLGVAAIGAGNQDSAVRLLTSGGELLVLRGNANPTRAASGIRVLATQTGQPG